MLNFLDKIDVYFFSKKKLLEENYLLKKRMEENDRLAHEFWNKSTAELVIEKIIKRGIGWYDWSELDNQKKKEYYNEIQSVVKNKSFINELNHLIADQVEYIARESKSHEDTMNIRMTINAVDLIKSRLENIHDPSVPKPSLEEIHEAI